MVINPKLLSNSNRGLLHNSSLELVPPKHFRTCSTLCYAIPPQTHLLIVILVRRGSRHRQVVNVVPRQRAAQQPQLAKLRLDRIPLDAHQIVLQVRIGVRIAVGKVHRIVVVLELDVERQRERSIPNELLIVVVDRPVMVVAVIVAVGGAMID